MSTTARPGLTADLTVRAVLIGAAAGARASLGVGFPTLAARPPYPLPARLAALAAVGGEMVWDQLPNCPSRLEWQGLAGRVAGGAVGATMLARAARRPAAAPAAIAVASALGTAVIAARWRRRWSEHRPAWLGGALEDAAALTVASLANR